MQMYYVAEVTHLRPRSAREFRKRNSLFLCESKSAEMEIYGSE